MGNSPDVRQASNIGDASATAAVKKRKQPKPRKKRAVTRPRTGVPPPLTFDLTRVPRSHKLSLLEVARAVRRTWQGVYVWTAQQDHPIKFEQVDGRWYSTVGHVLDYLNAGPEQRAKGRRKLLEEEQARWKAAPLSAP